MKEIIKKFEEEREKSPLCKLSLGKAIIQWDNLNCDSTYPFAFIAFLDGHVDTIDTILRKFEIENKGTPDFKNRFHDKCFLKNDEEKELKSLNSLLSALTELIVADYLSKTGEGIIQLSAHYKECLSDIKSKSRDIEYFTEVKYIGEIPELHSLVQETIKSGKHAGGGFIGNLSEIYNYINIRIADAVFQLEKNKIDIKNRRVFVAIKTSGPLKNILPSLAEKENWCVLSWNSLINKLNLSQKESNKYLSDTIGNYHNRCGKLVVGLMNDSYDLGSVTTF